MNSIITGELFSENAEAFTQSRKTAKVRKEKKIQKANIFLDWSLNDFAYSLRLSVFVCAFLFWFLLVRPIGVAA